MHDCNCLFIDSFSDMRLVSGMTDMTADNHTEQIVQTEFRLSFAHFSEKLLLLSIHIDTLST